MKKLILASAFALMATPALFAQSDNSFSMQIELKNGTKITLGPNDLKNISFVDGAIKIEGNTIEDLRMAIEKAEANTKNMVAEQRYDLNDLKKEAAELQAMIDYLSDKVAKLENAGGGSGSGSVGNEERIKLLEEAVNNLKADMNNLSSIEQIKKLQAQIDDLMAMVNVVATNSTGNQALADELKVKMTAVEAALDNLSSYITTNQSNISELRTASLALNEKVSANKAELMELYNDLGQSFSEAINLTNKELRELDERVCDNRVEYTEAIVKTNDQVAKVVNSLQQETQAEIGKLEAMLSAAIDALAKEVNVRSKELETNQDIMQSKITTLEGNINKEISERIAKTSDLEKAVAYNKALTDDKLEELQYKIDMIIKFLNANIFHSNYGENAYNKWAGISQ